MLVEHEPMNWGYTGTRQGMTARQKYAFDQLITPGDLLHHGACVGSDEEAAFLAASIEDVTVIAHPCNLIKFQSYKAVKLSDVVHGEKAPLERNQDIVNSCRVLIAAPRTLTEELRSGTWATIRYARKINRPVIILEP